MDIDRLKPKIEEQLKAWDVPSASVAIVKGDEEYTFGIGMKDGKALPAGEDTLYMIASCTKAFTAAACAVLATEGKLDFDVPVREYMPEFRLNDDYATANLTIRDFLSHRTGLPRHEMAWYGTGFSRDQLMKNLKYLPLNAPVRYVFQYSNFNYLIAGSLIERISGMPFETFMKEKLLKPLGMDRTVVYFDEMRKSEDHAVPFAHSEEYTMTGIREIPFYESPAEDASSMTGDPTAAAGCICSCASDMVKWLRFLLSKGKAGDVQLIREDLMELMITPHTDTGDGGPYGPQRSMTSYALGWSIYNYRGFKMAEHGGNINGFTSSVAFMPDLDLGMFISVNMDVSLLADAVIQDIADIYMEKDDGDWYRRMYEYNDEMFRGVVAFFRNFGGEPIEGTAPSHGMKEYAGTYEAPGYRRVLIEEKDGVLTLDFNTFRTKLKHHHYDTFSTVSPLGELPSGFLFTFGSDAAGRLSTVSATLGSEKDLKPIVFTKK